VSESEPRPWPQLGETGESLAPAGDAVSAAEGLTGALGQMRDEFQSMRGELTATRQASEERDANLRKGARRTRKMIIGLVLSLILDVTLTVVVSVIVAQQHSAQVAACRIGNQARTQQIQLWTHLVAISKAPPGETAAQRRAREETITGFLDYVKRSFAPRNCSRIYRLP